MWLAVTYAFLDSLNVLLIGVLVALGVLLPARARFGRIATLLVGGDWLGVFMLALATMLLFDGIGDPIKKLVSSSIFGVVLIAVGVLSIVLSIRGGDSSQMVSKLLPPLQTPSVKTFATGFLLGVIQSATSVPFFAGIAVLSVGDLSVAVRYGGMFFYALAALSLPTAAAIGVGLMRLYPDSIWGRGFERLRSKKQQLAKVAGYIVGAILVILGIFHL
ncbi:hypothetical protein NXS99_01330 [Corynebacterium sp. HS2168-gen11]|nr:hypothetical protein [Corynebacterium sp. HS2168-gen11]